MPLAFTSVADLLAQSLCSYSVGRRGAAIGPISRDLRPNVTVRIRLPLGRRLKRMVKSAARRGIEASGAWVGVGRDNACFPNRYHSRRSFTLVP